MRYRLTWRGQPEPGTFGSIEAAKAQAEADSWPRRSDCLDHIVWHESPADCRELCWGSDGYNNWAIYEETK